MRLPKDRLEYWAKYELTNNDEQPMLLKQMAKEIIELRAEREWISVKDRLPTEMGDYICMMDVEPDMGTRIDIVYYAIKEYGSMASESTGWAKVAKLHDWATAEVTHWMPFPKPLND